MLFTYNAIMTVAMIPCMIMSCIMADYAQREVEVFLPSERSSFERYSGLSQIKDIKAYLITNAIVTSFLTVLFVIHLCCIPCVRGRLSRSRRYEERIRCDDLPPQYAKILKMYSNETGLNQNYICSFCLYISCENGRFRKTKTESQEAWK